MEMVLSSEMTTMGFVAGRKGAASDAVGTTSFLLPFVTSISSAFVAF